MEVTNNQIEITRINKPSTIQPLTDETIQNQIFASANQRTNGSS